MQLSELRSRIGDKLGDPNHNEFSTTRLDEAINISQKRIVLDTRCLQDTNTISIVSGTREYDLPADFLMALGVKIDGDPLEPTTKKSLDYYAGESWDDLEGTPEKYYIDNQDPDTKVLGFERKPDESGTDNCELLYVVKPTDLSATTDVPFNSHTLMYPYHEAIVHDVVQDLLQNRELTAAVQGKIAFHQREFGLMENRIVSVFKNAANKQWRLKGGRRWIY